MLKDLAGRGWIVVDPPLDRDEQSVVARYQGHPIRAGFTMEENGGDEQVYAKFRSGKYNLELKVDFLAGHGQLRVQEADGYDA